MPDKHRIELNICGNLGMMTEEKLNLVKLRAMVIGRGDDDRLRRN